jgi:hypothetical protein
VSAPDDDLELEFTAGRRRRNIIAAIVAGVVIAAVAVGVSISRANRLPALDPDRVREVREALDRIPPQYRQELAAAALVELEQQRLPASMLDTFNEFASVSRDMADLILLRSLQEPEVQQAWLLACDDGIRVVADAGAHGRGAEVVHERCDLGRWGLLAASELSGVSLGKLVLTHAAWAHLVEHDSETDIERRLLRTMLGR